MNTDNKILEPGYYYVRYYYWTIGQYFGNGWQLVGIERTFTTDELHAVGSKITVPDEYKLGIKLKP